MRWATLAILAVFASAGAACRPAQGPAPRLTDGAAALGPIHAVEVSDADFAGQAQQILSSRVRDEAERDLLAGVVRRQLKRAQERFTSGADEAGLQALEGAMLLIRPSTYHPAIFENAEPALKSGAEAVARLGNEGRSLALYSILSKLLPPGQEHDDVDRHLAELETWTKAMRQAGPMQNRGVLQRTAVDRALLEASPQRIREAHEATIAWVEGALDFDPSALDVGTSPEQREEAVQAYRAIKAGGVSLVALYLRSGDADGALQAVQDSAIERVVPPALVDRLKDAARGAPEAWAELNGFYQEISQEQQVEISIDSAVARSAAWGTAVELYRLAPHDVQGVMPLAQALQARGMSEVAPRVLAEAFDENSDAYPLSWALALILHSILSESEIGQHEAARRTFEAAVPLIKLAERKRIRSQVRPSAAQLYYAAGALEAQAGFAHHARQRLAAALALDTTDFDTITLLAEVERQRGNTTRSLQLLSKAANVAIRRQQDADAASAALAIFEVHRDRGDETSGENALQTALSRALAARASARNNRDLARAERLLARVLEHYGDLDGARRATQRALEAARSDSEELAATLLDAARRALTMGDLRLARVAARDAIEQDVDGEDLVYIALWLQLLEQRLGEQSDGSALEAFTSLHGKRWIETLAAWGRGDLDDAELKAAADSIPQRTEAAFYTAMRAHRSANATAGLRPVADSEATQLVEVTIARDLLANAAAKTRPKLPATEQVP